MLSKIWKKVLLIILIIACIFDIMIKLVKKESLKQQLEETIKYIKNDDKENIVTYEGTN